jgi:N-acetylmuramate 1-kinase
MSGLRQEKCVKWLNSQHNVAVDTQTLKPASSDASFRRYFRVSKSDGTGTLIVMDAPPPNEDVRPFIMTTGKLVQAGVNAPRILAQNESEGFLLLDDLGDQTMLQVLQADPDCRDAVYRKAMSLLVQIQAKADVSGLAPYSAEKLRQEMDLFDEWFVRHHFKSELSEQEARWLEAIKSTLIASALAEGQVFVHRDYHSRNLMVVNSDPVAFGVIDHQDAVLGPVSYDVVSILRDAYVEWPEDETLDWAIRFWEEAKNQGVPVASDPAEFYKQIDFMGLQRHLKILGIFSRLNYRDGKSQYLKDLRLVTAYVRITAGRYDQFKPLLHILDRLENKEVEVGYTF